ncbi:hypothetical protein [Dongia sp.]|uniref:hypothetical protein n=1 Tax=Dongia sp. TaxID=1977262 RepID=UPI0035AFF5E9
MARGADRKRRVALAAQAKYEESRKARRAPRSERIYRAVAKALFVESVAQIIDTRTTQIESAFVARVMKRALASVKEDGFSGNETRFRLNALISQSRHEAKPKALVDPDIQHVIDEIEKSLSSGRKSARSQQ